MIVGVAITLGVLVFLVAFVGAVQRWVDAQSLEDSRHRDLGMREGVHCDRCGNDLYACVRMTHYNPNKPWTHYYCTVCSKHRQPISPKQWAA